MARQFGATWWGKAWVGALEQRARLDPNRLPRGRTYARHNRVEGMMLARGTISARVQGSDWEPYRVVIRFRELDEREWEKVIDLIVSRAAFMAALLDGELDADLVAAAEEAGVDLLPGPGELQPRCSCPDWADPCKHSAAVCYLVADELDEDPFQLLFLRGRDREEVTAACRQRRAEQGSPMGTPQELATPIRPTDLAEMAADPGLRASTAWQRSLGDLPEVPSVRPAPGRIAAWPVDPPNDASFTAEGLRALATDAAERSWEALIEDRSPLASEVRHFDLARRVCALLDGRSDSARLLDAMAHRAGLRPRELERIGLAWEVAGTAGVAMADESPWRPNPIDLSAGREALIASGISPSRLRVSDNRITVDRDTQLRLSRSGHWYRFFKRSGTWQLDEGPADDADDLVD